VEGFKYRFYFGQTNPPPLIDTGVISMSFVRPDTLIVDRAAYFSTGPDSVFRGLLPTTMYYYKIVLKDLLGDSSVYKIDSFMTRGQFAKNCTTGMALVEVNSTVFCMDTREFSNERYQKFDSSFSIADDATSFSVYTNTPVVFVDFEHAESACLSEGKRLCKVSEWEAAIGGYEERLYPYGNTYDKERCNVNLDFKSYSKGLPTTWSNDTASQCFTPEGIYDLSGNVAEWVINDKYFPVNTIIDGFPRPYRYSVGGAWASGLNSSISNVDKDLPSPPAYEEVRLLDVGFRCCKSIE
jgi:formylglycine-generating enzyme required for sulfatase activity